MRIAFLILLTGLCLSLLANIFLTASRYYAGKADHALLVSVRAAYKSQGCRLQNDMESAFDSLSANGFADLAGMHALSQELQKKAADHPQTKHSEDK